MINKLCNYSAGIVLAKGKKYMYKDQLVGRIRLDRIWGAIVLQNYRNFKINNEGMTRKESST